MMAWWLPAAVSLAVLVFIYGFNGYIHPDEFFQYSEVLAGKWFSVVHYTPWEYLGQTPCRSVLIPLVLFIVPCVFLKDAGDLYIYQVVMMMMIVGKLQRSIESMLARMHKTASALILLSPVWFTFLMRPFSNSIETVMLSAVFLRTFPRITRREMIGHLLALGFFNRPTFAFFAFAPVISWLYDYFSIFKSRRRLLTAIAQDLLVPGLLMSVFNIWVDTLFFGYFNWSWKCGGKVTDVPSRTFDYIVYRLTNCTATTPLYPIVTPLNWLRYNMQASNLAEHGIHPRITHAAVYMPMLFGVLAAAFFAFFAHLLYQRSLKNSAAMFVCPPAVMTLRAHLGGDNVMNEPRYSWQESEWKLIKRATYYLLSSIAVPLAALSAAPHQEARFLVPLIVPLMLAFSHLARSSRALKYVSVGHTVLVSLFFGVLHQGGLLPAMAYQRTQLRKPPFSIQAHGYEHHLIYHKTYMPPRSVLAWPQKFSGHLHVHDLGGAPQADVQALVRSLYCASNKSPLLFHTWLMAPCVVPVADWARRSRRFLTITVEERFGPHLSTEDLPRLLTAADCVPTDTHCQAAYDPEHQYTAVTPVLNFLRFSMRLCLYRIEFENASCPLPAVWNCTTP